MLPALLARQFSVTGLSPGVLNLSRHVRHKLTCSRDPRAAALAMRELIARERFDWIVVGDDALFRALLETGDREALRGWFPVDPFREDLVALVSSKHAFAQQAPELGVPVPESRLAATVSAATEAAATFGFPVVVKGPHGFAGSEVRIAENDEDLLRASQTLLERYGNVLLQRFVRGSNASAAILYERGKPLAYKAYFTECAFPHPHSAATVHRTLRHSSVEPIVRAIGAATGFHGMAGIDFVVEEGTGRLFAIEINPRPTSAFSGLRADRTFFGPAVARFLEGGDAPTERYEARDGAQAYFPDYAFYFLNRANKVEPGAYRRLLSCLAESSGSEAPIAAWAIARYAYDRVGHAVPGLRAWLDSRRRARRP
jgi:glutathione synthase/RimK-type ligase-like ATP-grasp enzyme